MKTPIDRIHAQGQSLWYDNIQRRLIEDGSLAAMIARGEIRGITSNPSIFHAAISRTADYDPALVPMAWSGWDPERIFWQMAVEDIRDACDLFAGLYARTQAADGYVSLEVSPNLAGSSEATYTQARRLWDLIDRPNLMIKIPATIEGLPAVRRAIAAGLNVNVTLIFSVERYRQVMEAYLAGLQDRLESRLPVTGIASVASFFVSRMDSKVDRQLAKIGTPDALALRGRAAIAYARMAYQEYRKVFDGERFAALHAAGCRPQRPLWASTSTKDPAYADTLYVDELVGPGTVNTVPPHTLEAVRQHGRGEPRLEHDLAGAGTTLQALEGLGIHMQTVTRELEQEGVQAFSTAFDDMLEAIQARAARALGELGPLAGALQQRMTTLTADLTAARLWARDASLWSAEPRAQQEIEQRLGWLTLPESSLAFLKEITAFVRKLPAEGIRRTLLLGMGGSSLAPEVLQRVFREDPQAQSFAILDSTDPAQVAEIARRFPPEESLYLVSSKSGGTAEVNALFAYFWALARSRLGAKAGRHFAAITDPGTSLERLAAGHKFRKTFLADPGVGGRFSALTHFGLVPAALIGLDPQTLLARAGWCMRQCAADKAPARNPGLVLGAILGQAALAGRDKLTLIADPALEPLGAWLEQLIMESTGKQGRGIVVVEGEPPGKPGDYGADRLFVHLRRDGSQDRLAAGLRARGHPLLTFQVQEAADLAVEFYRWELATAVAGCVLGVNAFDQPDVQDSKDRTLQKIDAYRQTGQLEQEPPIWEGQGVQVFSSLPLRARTTRGFIDQLLRQAGPGDYIALNAYLPRTEEMRLLLSRMRTWLRKRTGCATTVGFGPRFLHSTGQLHKGGPPSGLFLQITADADPDLDIPGQPFSFGVLQRAQALGDFEALAARQRRLVRLHFSSPKGFRDWADTHLPIRP